MRHLYRQFSALPLCIGDTLPLLLDEQAKKCVVPIDVLYISQ